MLMTFRDAVCAINSQADETIKRGFRDIAQVASYVVHVGVAGRGVRCVSAWLHVVAPYTGYPQWCGPVWMQGTRAIRSNPFSVIDLVSGRLADEYQSV